MTRKDRCPQVDFRVQGTCFLCIGIFVRSVHNWLMDIMQRHGFYKISALGQMVEVREYIPHFFITELHCQKLVEEKEWAGCENCQGTFAGRACMVQGSQSFLPVKGGQSSKSDSELGHPCYVLGNYNMEIYWALSQGYQKKFLRQLKMFIFFFFLLSNKA